jgi:glutamate-5-semialdehyde dehydrogenase
MDVQTYMHSVGRAARSASRLMARADTATKNKALTVTAEAIVRSEKSLLEANARDAAEARHKKLDDAAIDRLILTPKTIAAMADGLCKSPHCPIPSVKLAASNIVRRASRSANARAARCGRHHLRIRPNVTADAAGLVPEIRQCRDSARRLGGLASNQAFACMRARGSCRCGFTEGCGAGNRDLPTARRWANSFTMQDYVDVIVPRGGQKPDRAADARITHPDDQSICTVCAMSIIDDKADIDKAIRVADNAKTQRLGTCNTLETLLVARGIAKKILPRLCKIYIEKGIELRGDEESRSIVPQMNPRATEDWYTEYLAAILSCA